ncbi:hypothetical protein U8C37_25370 (plasmid) [Sinorhizobium medicae]|uniref:hypothetical protein n=1 Tax=Sinorhizobium medicae TaxID=110321 RepID=UPI002AF6A133|nr:hypothetical protein [Sinorhizobium medicae]WQO88045.1 hypothetical protein U8C37_25370 [Sinorhizobium medicae]
MVSPVSGIYAKVRQKFHLSPLFKFPEPALCANGEHENPDMRVLEVLLDSRLGSAEHISPNPQAREPFTIWFNCSTAYLEKQQAAHTAKKGAPSDKLAKCIAQFTAIEQKLADAKQASNGRLKLKYLKVSPLVLDV